MPATSLCPALPDLDRSPKTASYCVREGTRGLRKEPGARPCMRRVLSVTHLAPWVPGEVQHHSPHVPSVTSETTQETDSHFTDEDTGSQRHETTIHVPTAGRGRAGIQHRFSLWFSFLIGPAAVYLQPFV